MSPLVVILILLLTVTRVLTLISAIVPLLITRTYDAIIDVLVVSPFLGFHLSSWIPRIILGTRGTDLRKGSAG